MTDLVGTCPKGFWEEWIEEGDAAGEPETGQEYGWYTTHWRKRLIKPGDRFYVVAHDKLRGWAPAVRVDEGCIVRAGQAVACTIQFRVPGFRGLKERWWLRDEEIPFPEWRTP